MKRRTRTFATIVLALLSACASQDNGDTAASSSETSSADDASNTTGSGSASGSASVTDSVSVTVTGGTSSGSTNGGESSSGETTAASTTTGSSSGVDSSSGVATDSGGLSCDLDHPDDCTVCQREKCCDLYQFCGMDPDCTCMAECVGAVGLGGVDGCLGDCGLAERPRSFSPLEECMTLACPDSDECSAP